MIGSGPSGIGKGIEDTIRSSGDCPTILSGRFQSGIRTDSAAADRREQRQFVAVLEFRLESLLLDEHVRSVAKDVDL